MHAEVIAPIRSRCLSINNLIFIVSLYTSTVFENRLVLGRRKNEVKITGAGEK